MSLRIVALLGLSSLALSAQAQSQFRLYAEAGGTYFNGITTTSPLFGLDAWGNPVSTYGAQTFGVAANAASAFDTGSPIPNVNAGGTWAGDAAQGMTTVTANAFGKTGCGSNHASASISGYTEVTRNYAGEFVVGGTTWPMQVSSQTAATAVGRSVWEELYQIGGGTGTGQFTGTLHIDGSLSGPLGNGLATLDWTLSTFSDVVIASVSASFDASTNSWTKSVLSNGIQTTTSGTGTLSFDENIIASYTFTYGAALYLKSDLSTKVSGNGTADFSNTVQFTGMRLPEDTAVYVFSGTPATTYGISFAGNGSGTICQDLACAVTAVPEPGSYALLLAGLGVLGWVTRRRMH